MINEKLRIKNKLHEYVGTSSGAQSEMRILQRAPSGFQHIKLKKTCIIQKKTVILRTDNPNNLYLWLAKKTKISFSKSTKIL